MLGEPMDPATFCFTCGQAVTDPPRLHRLEDGSACPACRDRALALLPPALPVRPRWGRSEPTLEDELERELGFGPDARRGPPDDDPPWSA